MKLDPKDKLFALLDMIDFNLDSLGQPHAIPKSSRVIPSALMPNYKKSVGEVYHDLACYQLATEQRVHALTSVQHSYQADKWKLNSPSWVPVWDQGELVEPLWFPEAPAANFSAAVPEPINVTFELKFSDRLGKMLKTCAVDGAAISRVASTNELELGDVEATDSRKDLCFFGMKWWICHNLLKDWERNDKFPFLKKKFRDQNLRSLAVALTAGRQLPPDGIIRAGDDEALRKHMQRFASWICSLEAECFSMFRKLQKQLRADDRFTINAEDAQSYAKRVESVCKERRLFRTETGLLGLGPAHLRKYDTVCILRSGQVPFILREDNFGLHQYQTGLSNSYFLIGPCYVYGMMDGDLAYRMQSESKKFILV